MAHEDIFYAGPARWNFDGKIVDFMPTGPLHVIAGNVSEVMLRKNPGDWRESRDRFRHIRGAPGDVFSARIIIGQNVGPTPTWTPDDIKAVLFSIYEKINPKDPGMTLVQGEGVFRGQRNLVSEKSSQISIINFALAREQFEDVMFQLAHGVADALLQESVILDLQNRGQSYHNEMIESKLPKHKMDPVKMAGHIMRVKALTARFNKRFKEAQNPRKRGEWFDVRDLTDEELVEFAREQAATHFAYGWAKKPGSTTRLWTPEARRAYDEEYNQLYKGKYGVDL